MAILERIPLSKSTFTFRKQLKTSLPLSLNFQNSLVTPFPACFNSVGEFDGENWGKKRIEKLMNANIPSFIGLEKSVNGIKTSITRSLAEFDTFAVSYNKESSVLKDSLEQVILLTC